MFSALLKSSDSLLLTLGYLQGLLLEVDNMDMYCVEKSTVSKMVAGESCEEYCYLVDESIIAPKILHCLVSVLVCVLQQMLASYEGGMCNSILVWLKRISFPNRKGTG